MTTRRSALYTDLWMNKKNLIIERIAQEKSHTVQMNQGDFESVGDRKSYSFRLSYIHGIVSNNISGSAVAGDLARVLETERALLHSKKNIVIRLDRDFRLHIDTH